MSIQRTAKRLRNAALLLLVPMNLAYAQPPVGGDPCAGAESMELNATVRQTSQVPRTEDLYELYVEDKGILALHLSAPVSASAEPLLEFLGQGCTEPSSNGFSVIEETPRGVVLNLREVGTYYLTVSSENPSSNLGSYKLRSGFSSDPETVSEMVLGTSDPPASCGAVGSPAFELTGGSGSESAAGNGSIDPWDCDVVSGIVSGGVLMLQASGVDLSTKLFADDGCTRQLAAGDLEDEGDAVTAPVHAGEHRLMIDPFGGSSGSYSIYVHHYPVCSNGEQDDIGDSPLCASQIVLASGKEGILDNADGDDEDYFHFYLGQQQTVSVSLDAGVAAHCSLYDDGYLQLASWSECGGSTSEEIVETLGTGLYTVRVASSSSEETSYTLNVSEVEE